MTERIVAHEFPGDPVSGYDPCVHCKCPYVKRETISCYYREAPPPEPVVRESVMFLDLSARIAEIQKEEGRQLPAIAPDDPAPKPPSWANLIATYQAA